MVNRPKFESKGLRSNKTGLLLFYLTIVFFSPSISAAEKNIWDTIKSITKTTIETGKSSLNQLLGDLETDLNDLKHQNKVTNGIDVKEKIDGIKLYVDQITSLKKEETKASSFTLFKSSKKDYRVKINEVLQEIEPLLFDGLIVNYSKRIRNLNRNIKNAKAEIADLNEKLIFASEKKSFLGNNKNSIELEIKNYQKGINASEKLIDSLEFDLKKKLYRLGIKLNRKQIKVLTSRVDGDDLAKTLAIFDVTKQITKTLQLIMEKNKFSSSSTVKYYGMYVILSEMVSFSQKQYINKIKNVYLPALKEIDGEIDDAIQFANQALKTASSEQSRNSFNSNIKSNKFAKYVVKKYNEILGDQMSQLVTALKKSNEQISVAYSTYDTAAISANLVNLISATQKEFNEILNLQIPKIVPFESVELQNKFIDISEKLVKKSNLI